MAKEYKIYSYVYKNDTEQEENDLNKLAEQGWRVINVITGYETQANTLDSTAEFYSGIQVFLERDK